MALKVDKHRTKQGKFPCLMEDGAGSVFLVTETDDCETAFWGVCIALGIGGQAKHVGQYSQLWTKLEPYHGVITLRT